jgi:hypothetical protein
MKGQNHRNPEIESSVATLIPWLALVTLEAVSSSAASLVPGLPFVSQQSRGLTGSNPLLQLFNLQLRRFEFWADFFVLHGSHLLSTAHNQS